MSNDDWIKNRLAQSRRLLDGWEEVGRPAGKLDDILELIRREIEVLEDIGADVSEWPAIPAGYLIGRYKGFRRRLKSLES